MIPRQENELLAIGRSTADPRYVRDVTGFLLDRITQRKLQLRDALPRDEQRRLAVFVLLHSHESSTNYFGA